MRDWTKAIVIVGVILGLAFLLPAQSLRKFTCEIFKCQAFQDLVTLTVAIHADIQDLGPGSVDLSAIEDKLDMLMLPEASIWLKGASGNIGDLVLMEIWIKGESLRKVEAFGFNINYPDALVQLDGMDAGPLLADWANVDMNVQSPGIGIAGGFMGTGTPIIGTAIGHLCTFRFTLLASGGAGIFLDNYVDGLADFFPDGTAATIIVN